MFFPIYARQRKKKINTGIQFQLNPNPFQLLRRTIGTAPTDAKKWTVAWWMIRYRLFADQNRQDIVCTGGAGNFYFGPVEGNHISLGYGGYIRRRSTMTFAINTLYHCCMQFDSTQAAENDRAKLFVNSTQVTFNTGDLGISLNEAPAFLSNGLSLRIGSMGGEIAGAQSFPGVLADVHIIDGYVQPASMFYNAPPYTGPWGNQGTLNEFLTSGSLGLDTSGNDRHYSVEGTPTQYTGSIQ